MRFYLVDRITDIVPAKRITAVKLVSALDPALEHDPVMGPSLAPTLAIEALAQASAWLVMATTDFRQRGVLASIRNGVVGSAAPLGDRLDLTSEVDSWSDEAVVFNFEASCRGASVVRAEGVLCFLLDAGQLEDPEVTRQHYQALLREGTPPGDVLPSTPGKAVRWVGPPISSQWAPYDVLDEIVPGERATARKSVVMMDPVFATHFPRLPVNPGVFLVQSMVEVCRALLRASARPGVFWRLRTIRAARFQRYVRPGDLLILTARLQKLADGEASLTCQGLLSTGEQAVALRTITFSAQPQANAASGSD